MTKTVPVLLTLVLFATALLMPTAAAHGAPPQREIDTRVLAEGLDGFLDYGSANGLAEDVGQDLPVIPLYEGGHDLLSLDVREAWGPDEDGEATEGLYMRLAFRRGHEGPIRDVVTMTIGEASKDVAWSTTDNEAFTGEGFTWVSPLKFPVATYEDAVDGFVPYSALGVEAGVTIDAFDVVSHVEDAKTDIMPGSYYYEGEEMPDGTQTGETIDEAYTLAGPAELLTAALVDAPASITEATTLEVDVRNVLEGIPQVVEAEARAPAGAQASFSDAGFQVDNGSAMTITIDVDPGSLGEDAVLELVFLSDLGGRAVVDVPLGAPATPDVPDMVTSEDLATGDSFSFVFHHAGTFSYHDHHSGAEATIMIGASAEPTEHQVAFDGAWDPAKLDIHAGDTVTWTNNADAMMRVMGTFGAMEDLHAGMDHMDHDEGHMDHDVDSAASQDAPGIGLALLVVGLFGLLALARR